MNDKIIEIFNKNGFGNYIYDENIEFETWTNDGVNMIVIGKLDNLFKDIRYYINTFDIDEEIDIHRENKLYKDSFTIKESLKDFEDYHYRLKSILKEIEKIKKDLTL